MGTNGKEITRLLAIARGSRYASDQQLAALREFHSARNIGRNPIELWIRSVQKQYPISPDPTIATLAELITYATPPSCQTLIFALHDAASKLANNDPPHQANQLIEAIRKKEEELTRPTPKTASEMQQIKEVEANADAIRREAISKVVKEMSFSAPYSDIPHSEDSD